MMQTSWFINNIFSVNSIFTLGSLLALCSISVKRLIVLRLISLISASLFAIYGFLTETYIIVIWNSIHLTINFFRTANYFYDRSKLSLSKEEKDLYVIFFQNTMIPRDFKELLKQSKTIFYKNETIIDINCLNENLYFLLELDGSILIEKNGKIIEWTSNNCFFGEITWLKGGSTSVKIFVEGTAKCLVWNKEKLFNLKNDYPVLFNDFLLIISYDLISKIDAMNLREFDNPIQKIDPPKIDNCS